MFPVEPTMAVINLYYPLSRTSTEDLYMALQQPETNPGQGRLEPLSYRGCKSEITGVFE